MTTALYIFIAYALIFTGVLLGLLRAHGRHLSGRENLDLIGQAMQATNRAAMARYKGRDARI